MAIQMAGDTREVLGRDAGKCDSRSLFMDRFADPGAKDGGNGEPRRKWFNDLREKRAAAEALAANASRVDSLSKYARASGGEVLYAQLQSRLMLNMAGGVMENAGLCLDRFGLPYIPGSAVKGCARRMAIQSLVELREKNQSVEEIATALVNVALVFGWGESDWEAGRRSDFEYACGEQTPGSDSESPGTGRPEARPTWKEVRPVAARKLLDLLRVSKREHPTEPWKDLPNSGGPVAFLAAHPIKAGIDREPPELGALELDVVTCHHGGYYSGKPGYETAPDTEEPVPVVFPAVAPGHVFMFTIVPLRNCPAERVRRAVEWLTEGLQTFGLGAKTNAGYGWFSASEELQGRTAGALEKRRKQQEEQRKQAREEEERKALEEVERKRREELRAALASMTPEQQEDYKIAELSSDQFRTKMENFLNLEKGEQEATVRALRDPRLEFWNRFKEKAVKGKNAQIADRIRSLSREMKLGKMP